MGEGVVAGPAATTTDSVKMELKSEGEIQGEGKGTGTGESVLAKAMDVEGEGLGLTELRDGLGAWQRAVGHVRGAKRGREDQPAFLTWNGHLLRLEPRLRLLGFGPQHEPAVVTV